jgi:hypothetical protein
MKGEPHLVAQAEQVAEAGLPLDAELMDTCVSPKYRTPAK